MVGKGDAKSSRIFHQCYLKCCKLQNLTPLNSVIPTENGRYLDFCVDRIKYIEWPPILNALSCDLSLHSVAIRCRQPVKTVLEHIDCERLAKTVNKRAVILTNFMLSNLSEAISQLLSNTTLLTSLLLEGLPLKIPYLNPLNEAILANSSLQHLYLPRCLIGDAGCLALCKAVRCLPNILTLDLSGCELTLLGATYLADLVKYQKIHRYSENWVHTLRYRLPDLDTMAGLRRITLCANPGLGDAGVSKLLEVLADDLWIKALDLQNCGLSQSTAANCLHVLKSNTTLVVLDLRYNPEISGDTLAKIRTATRENEKGAHGQFSWLNTVSGSSDRLLKTSIKNGVVRDRGQSATRPSPPKYASKTANGVKKERDYTTDELNEQLKEEISHRRQLEELNLQLVKQMKELKQQRIRLWANGSASSGSEQSLGASSRSYDISTSSGASSVPIDQNTLSYIQQAFRDIYAFIKNNQCKGECMQQSKPEPHYPPIEEASELSSEGEEPSSQVSPGVRGVRVRGVGARGGAGRRAMDARYASKSAHVIGGNTDRDDNDMKPGMIERQMGDTKNQYAEDQNLLQDIIAAQIKNKMTCSRSGSSSVSSSTLRAVNPRDALHSSSSSDSGL